MGSKILKADREHDLYCRWSSIVDGPTMAGTRAETAEFLFNEYAMDQSCYEGNHANCPVPVLVQRQEQGLCGPVVEFSEEQQA